ncbi:LppX_LprAFG lipoprotein [Nonomuraea terrae]|uniref:LppX_LprAFG lipoprotein n=1 Tax=Nonomuraea terrae TaxID=2530383 RepID=UPI001FE473CA|nr:LppX_LprAFG lipoprotein [Nonomuraea terrae]
MLKRTIVMTAAGAALVMAAVAGCGSNAQPIQVNLAASEVLTQAAQKTAEVTSYTVDAVVDVQHPQEGAGKVQGRMVYQSKPQLAADLTLDTVDMGGRGVPGGVRAVLQGDTVYVKVQALNEMLGAAKPWIRVPLAETGDSGEARRYLDQIQQFDLGNMTKLVTASQDVKAVGTESVNGEDTTHYSGTFPVDVAVQQLPADRQEQARQGLAELQNVKFDIWVASDGLPRKLALNGSKEGATLDATLLFKGFNETVSIEAPPADQVGELPQPTTD